MDFTAILIGARTTAHIDTAFDRLDLDAPASWMDEMNSRQNLQGELAWFSRLLIASFQRSAVSSQGDQGRRQGIETNSQKFSAASLRFMRACR